MDKNKQQTIKQGLYLVSTPIGIMEDISFRALNILKKSNIISKKQPKNISKCIKSTYIS